MVFRPLQAQNLIKFDWDQWVNILGTITHKNNPLDCKGERPQIMVIGKSTSKTRFLTISPEKELT
jgi:hypothetical protein